MVKVLFICLGNICRSPAAEGVLRRMVEERGLQELIDIDSAGTYGGHAGQLPDSRMRNAASKRGLTLTHRARKIGEIDFDRFDYLIVMDDMNREDVLALAPTIGASKKVHRMVEFCQQYDNSYVPDPYYEGWDGFELVLNLLEDACGGLLEHLLKEL